MRISVFIIGLQSLVVGFMVPTPPLGYSTWNFFPYKAIDEDSCYAMADALVSTGLRDAGYRIFIVDEPCFIGRDASGVLIENKTTWPKGLKAFGTYLNKLNMTLGIYTDAGRFTCQQCPGSQGYEALDVKTFASWGATYIKVDRCFGVDSEIVRENLPETYQKYRKAADMSGKNIQISAILAGTDNCWEWGNGTVSHCRTTGDIHKAYICMQNNLDNQEKVPYIHTYAGPGYFNDLDMLIVGLDNNGPVLSYAESQSHMALWAILKSPILISYDVRKSRPEILALLTNKGMMRVSQDSLGIQAKLIRLSWSRVPNGVSFQGCPPDGEVLDMTQKWTFKKDIGHLVAATTGQCLTVQNCGSKSGTHTMLCDCSLTASKNVNDSRCSNTTCHGNDRIWNQEGSLLKSNISGLCLEGILGPQLTTVSVMRCNSSNEKQLWKYNVDGTLTAWKQCLTTDPIANSNVDLYAGPLDDGSIVVAIFNRQQATTNATLNFVSDLKFKPGTKAKVQDVWTGNEFGIFTDTWSSSITTHGVAFVTICRVSSVCYSK